MTTSPDETPVAESDPAVPSGGAERTRRRLARLLPLIAVAILGLLLLRGLAEGGSTSGGGGEPAPAFVLPLLGGGEVRSEEFAGRALVINVWASWCPPCREEAPALRRVFESVDPNRVAFLGVVRQDDPRAAEAFRQEFGLTYPNGYDNGDFAHAYGVRGLPMTFVVAPDGTLTARHFGAIGEERLRALIDDALAYPGDGGAGGS